MRKLMTGNTAVSHAVMLARVQLISAYPITPQTTIVEELSEMVGDGRIKARFIRVESEHSAMACVTAACAAGVRVFTATSSHGLAYMHEVLHWASGTRLPVVMVNANRTIGAPWNIWCDLSDSLSQRDTGWLQIYCQSAQEALDTVLQAYRIAEEVLLPVMVLEDGFVLSHTSEPVDVPEPKDVDRFLPPYKACYPLSAKEPHTYNILTDPSKFILFRHEGHKAMDRAKKVAAQVDREFKSRFGRGYGLLERFRATEADVVLLALGTPASTAREVIDAFRKDGKKVGLIRQRLFRPFPTEEVIRALSGVKKVAVLDRASSLGAGGILAQELKAALFNAPRKPKVFEFIAGLGGKDITPETLRAVLEKTLKGAKPEGTPVWMED